MMEHQSLVPVFTFRSKARVVVLVIVLDSRIESIVYTALL